MARGSSGTSSSGKGKQRTRKEAPRPSTPASPSSPISKKQEEEEDLLFFNSALKGAAADDDEDDDEGSLVDDEGDDYVFNPADFPMLEGEIDFFGDMDGLEEESLTPAAAAAAAAGGVSPTTPLPPKRQAKLPVIAVIGRPNVGKSTIVNRLCKTMSTEPDAIVYDYEGVTRDRIYRKAEWNGRMFEVVDTGGLIFDEDQDNLFAPQIREQALLALEESVAAILVVDGQVGVTTLDEEIAKFLRLKKNKPIYVAVNKCETQNMGEAMASMFWKLGLGEPFPVSGLHGTGVAEVLESMLPHIYHVDEAERDDAIKVAIVGRPNVGKSSLLNRLYGKERAIVSDIAGTTRDAVDAMVEANGKMYKFIDTAGIRRRKKVEYGNEFLMVNRALKAVRRADVVLLVVDVVEGVNDQDKILAQRIADDGRACVIVANKWDAVEKDDKTFNEAVIYVKEELFAVNWADVLFTSALTGQRCHKIFEAVDKAAAAHRMRVKTAILNEVLGEALKWQRPPTVKSSQQGRVYYCNQVATEPPAVVVFCNNPKLFPDSYKRYLDRKFRESLDLTGTPIRWHFRGKKLRQLAKTGSPVPYGMPGS
jgi:GTP-binding protein